MDSNNLLKLKNITIDKYYNTKSLHYRNYLNVDFNHNIISNINSKFAIKIFYFIKNFINYKLKSKIINIKLKENHKKQYIVCLEVNEIIENDFNIIIRLLKYYSYILEYCLLELIIFKNKPYTIFKISTLQEEFLNKKYNLLFDIFSRINYSISTKIYRSISDLMTSGELLLCLGRDVIIPSNLNNHLFDKILVVSHNKNILKEVKHETVFKCKSNYYQIIDNLKIRNKINIFISSGRKGLGQNMIDSLSKLTKCNLIIIWCTIDSLIFDYSLLSKFFKIRTSIVFNEHPNTNNLTTLINLYK